MPTSFNPALVDMIRCPVTKTSLRIAADELVGQINSQIDKGEMLNNVGQKVTDKLEGGLINDDASLLLPIRGGIVILVTDQAIPLGN